MTEKHSPENWIVCGYGTRIEDAHGENVFHDASANEADLKRICACVNACKGINPEAVPEMLAILESTYKTLAREESLLPNEDHAAIGEVISKAKEGQP